MFNIQDKKEILEKIDENRILLEDILRHMVKKKVEKPNPELKEQAKKALEKKGQTIFQQQPNETGEEFANRVFAENKRRKKKSICKCGHSIDFHYGEEHENNPCHYRNEFNRSCDCVGFEPKGG